MLEDLSPNLKKDQLQELSLFSHVSISEIKKIFNAFLLIILCNYSQGKETYIPNIGTVVFKYNGDKLVKSGNVTKKKADVSVEFEIDNALARMLGQLENGEKLDIVKSMTNSIQNLIERKLDADS